jgi:hypothetical protein
MLITGWEETKVFFPFLNKKKTRLCPDLPIVFTSNQDSMTLK